MSSVLCMMLDLASVACQYLYTDMQLHILALYFILPKKCIAAISTGN